MVKKIDFQISRRQSGKTRSIVNMAVRDLFRGRKPCIITVNQNNARWLKQEYKTELKDVEVFSSISQIISPDSVIDVIYLDEYLYFREYDQRMLNDVISRINVDVYIKSTSNILVDREVFDLARFLRKNSVNADISFINENKQNQFNYLMNNLLTHPKTKLNVDYEYYRSVLDDYNFQTEYLGKLFK